MSAWHANHESVRRRFHQRLKLPYGILRICRAYLAKYESGHNR
jgi:hypothetical protein